MARAEGSRVRVVMIDAEGRENIAHCLAIRPEPADARTIAGILNHGLPWVMPDHLRFIADFCDGLPGIAVLAAASYRVFMKDSRQNSPKNKDWYLNQARIEICFM